MTSDGDVAYDVDTDPRRVDLDVVWGFLSTEAYWNRWRTRADVDDQVRGAWRVVGAYAVATGDMVGFARAVSDGVSDAYLGDMFVLAAHRGRGVATRILAAMIDDGPGRDFRWFLVTSDAHRLYSRFGFVAPDDRVMVRAPAARG
ncbi:MAG: GNAT family N-acetyltransferase [Acidimicrobiales bacterium]